MTIFQDLGLIAAQLNKHKRAAERMFERSINQGVRAACDLDHDQSCNALDALERVRASVGSELAARLRAVEEDLAKLHAAHTALASGEPAEALNTTEQDARSWALIEKWSASRAVPGYQLPVLEVEITGPFIGIASDSYYVRLPGGHVARGTSRSDALAHAAEWCRGQL